VMSSSSKQSITVNKSGGRFSSVVIEPTDRDASNSVPSIYLDTSFVE
jgi:hypothetical protein